MIFAKIGFGSKLKPYDLNPFKLVINVKTPGLLINDDGKTYVIWKLNQISCETST
jgi:hypothetical protein